MKQGKEDPTKVNPTGEGNGKSRNQHSAAQCVLKVLTPDTLAAAIIGKGGSVIASMRRICKGRIAISGYGDVYPNTDCRVLTVQAASEDTLKEVSKLIIQKLEELVKSSAVSEAVCQDGELKLCALVPHGAVGGLIGKGGATIKQIREASGAKILIGSGSAAEQLVAVVGSAPALEHVMAELSRHTQMLKAEPWFSTWASATTSFQAPLSAEGCDRGQLDARGTPDVQRHVDTMLRVAHDMPRYVMEDARGFALSCVVPNHLVGGLIGRGGAGTREVQMATNTVISIRDLNEDPDHSSMHIAGPLANACAAYMLMMERYILAEAQAPPRSGQQR